MPDIWFALPAFLSSSFVRARRLPLPCRLSDAYMPAGCLPRLRLPALFLHASPILVLPREASPLPPPAAFDAMFAAVY